MAEVDFTQDSPFPAQQAAFLSMRNVRARNRAGWLALFADDAKLEDPIGVSPFDPDGVGHQGKEAIGAFWDNVIAPTNGVIHVRETYPCGNECANVMTITQTLPNGKTYDVNFIGTYRVDAVGKIVALRAYWQFDKVAEGFAAAMAE
jgi:steroid delta-isomerase